MNLKIPHGNNSSPEPLSHWHFAGGVTSVTMKANFCDNFLARRRRSLAGESLSDGNLQDIRLVLAP
eukprot:404487-Hanusia_phi.AAC.1